jgi:RimJ/RimL family protein N-acetyltransferase
MSRLRLEPLTVDHAAAMVAVLGDPSIYEFTGGTPPTLDELTARYARQSAGRSPDGSEQWLNWVVLLGEEPIGYVQATVVGAEAEIAWVVSPAHQGHGFATEAAAAMVEHLSAAGVTRLVAHVHPDHEASGRVAARLGLRRTDVVEDGEVRWASPSPGSG